MLTISAPFNRHDAVIYPELLIIKSFYRSNGTQLDCGSDGGLHEGFGTMDYAVAADGQLLWKGAGPVNGDPTTASKFTTFRITWYCCSDVRNCYIYPFGYAYQHLPTDNKRKVTKMLYGWLNTGHQCAKITQESKSHCPRCNREDKSHEHVLTCRKGFPKRWCNHAAVHSGHKN